MSMCNKFVMDDGGKSYTSYANQRNDCAVRAYSIFIGIPYEESYLLFKKLGRCDNAATNIGCLDAALSGNYTKVVTSITINNLIKTYPRGRVYAIKKRHAFALIGGSIRDTYNFDTIQQTICFWIDEEAKKHATNNIHIKYACREVDKVFK